MSRIEIRGVIVPSNYDMEWMRQYIDKGIVTPESRVRSAIAGAAKNAPLELYINSPGGSVFAAYEIINALTEWRMTNNQPVNITVGAMAASAASAIAVLSGANLRLFRNSKMMFHGAWTETIGGGEAHKDTANLLEKINADIKTQLVSKFGIAAEVVDEWFAEGRAGWITATDAKSYGMAESVIDDDDEEVEFADADITGIEENGMAIAALVRAEVRAEDEQEIAPESEPEKTEEQADDGGKSDDEESDGSGEQADEPATDDEPESEPEAQPEESVEDRIKREAEALAALNVEGRVAELIAENDKVKCLLENETKERKKFQGQYDKEVEQRKADHKQFETRQAEMQAALEKANARIIKLTIGGLTFSPAIESWEEAMKATGGDYVQARTRYPDAYQEFMNRKNNHRK
jgi:ATP-dependent protease ClpP protease subunit